MPRTRRNVIVGEKSQRAVLTTTAFAPCGAALVTVPWPAGKPWAAGGAGALCRVCRGVHCCAARSGPAGAARLGVAALALGGLGLLLRLARGAVFLRAAQRLLGHDRGLGQVGADAFHLVADLVDLDQLLRRDEAVTDHRPVDQQRPRIG